MQEARLRNLTYAAPLYVDVRKREITRAGEGAEPVVEETLYEKTFLGDVSAARCAVLHRTVLRCATPLCICELVSLLIKEPVAAVAGRGERRRRARAQGGSPLLMLLKALKVGLGDGPQRRRQRPPADIAGRHAAPSRMPNPPSHAPN